MNDCGIRHLMMYRSGALQSKVKVQCDWWIGGWHPVKQDAA
jgi:hypothetical protein